MAEAVLSLGPFSLLVPSCLRKYPCSGPEMVQKYPKSVLAASHDVPEPPQSVKERKSPEGGCDCVAGVSDPFGSVNYGVGVVSGVPNSRYENSFS